MVVDIDLNTGKKTVIKPMNDNDKESLSTILMNLYRLHESREIQAS